MIKYCIKSKEMVRYNAEPKNWILPNEGSNGIET